VFLAAALMRLPLRVGVLAATNLAQVGEFFFVLIYAAEPFGLVSRAVEERLAAAVILSMLVTPLLLAAGPHLAAAAVRLRFLERLVGKHGLDDTDVPTPALSDHVIVAGWGVAGQELARALRMCGVPFIVVDLNPDNVRVARDTGALALFGDVTNIEVLERLGIERARELVVVINDPPAAGRAVAAARRLAPGLHILVRTRYLGDMPTLFEAGASEIVPAEIEAAVEVAARVLERHGVNAEMLAPILEHVRARRGEELRA
jgi:CPA2 family monovalent cation:H+ antiporter-2